MGKSKGDADWEKQWKEIAEHFKQWNKDSHADQAAKDALVYGTGSFRYTIPKGGTYNVTLPAGAIINPHMNAGNGYYYGYDESEHEKQTHVEPKKCTCGTNKTYGNDIELEAHSTWCDLREQK